METIVQHGPQVKICGLTTVEEALACVELGADAIGCVFYPPSPRALTEDAARAICRALPPGIPGVGVFVDAAEVEILGKVERCGLRAVQLHGREAPALVARLRAAGLLVIKALFWNGEPSFASAASYPADAFLAECAGGPLPGGNARRWEWGAARTLARTHPLILAGGLAPHNVAAAVAAAAPVAVDVSSGVETRPGTKDLALVGEFIAALRGSGYRPDGRRIFS
jgi:phosphoribosylanthranilate isomerase